MSDFWVWFEDLMFFFSLHPFLSLFLVFCFFSEIYSHICLVFWRWSSFFLQKSLFPYFWMKTVVISLSCKHVAFYMYLWETTSCTFCLFSRCYVDVSVVWLRYGEQTDILLVVPGGLWKPGQFPWSKFKHLCTVPVRHVAQTFCFGFLTCKLEWFLSWVLHRNMDWSPLLLWIQ